MWDISFWAKFLHTRAIHLDPFGIVAKFLDRILKCYPPLKRSFPQYAVDVYIIRSPIYSAARVGVFLLGKYVMEVALHFKMIQVHKNSCHMYINQNIFR